MKLLPLEDLGFWEYKVSKRWQFLMQALYTILVLEMPQNPMVMKKKKEKKKKPLEFTKAS
jgi:hypothetical protein